MAQPGLVVASHGRHCLVESPDGGRRLCHPRGKKSQAVVGDRVKWQSSGDEGVIEAVEPRRNLFYRQDEVRTKSFAANLDLVLVLIAAEPEFSEMQLARALIAAEAEHIAPLIALNKSDLVEPFERAWGRLMPYQHMGYGVLPNMLIGALIGFFPVVINTAVGLTQVDEELLDLGRVFGAPTWKVFLKIRLPNALPYVLSALKITATAAVVGAVVGEFVASQAGLGMVIVNAQTNLNTPVAFAALMWISIIGLVLYGLVGLVARWWAPWAETGS